MLLLKQTKLIYTLSSPEYQEIDVIILTSNFSFLYVYTVTVTDKRRIIKKSPVVE